MQDVPNFTITLYLIKSTIIFREIINFQLIVLYRDCYSVEKKNVVILEKLKYETIHADS